MKKIGTILPTAKSIKANRAFSQRERTAKQTAAFNHGLTQYEKRNVHGEERYYKTATLYAVIKRNMEPAWFEVREDGEYRI